MKKLLFTLGAFACAVSVQAASYSWSNVAYPVNAYNQPGPQGALQESGTMYLINAATVIGTGEDAHALTQAYFIETVLGAGAGYESAFNTLVANAKNFGTLTTGSKFATINTGSLDNGKALFDHSDEGQQSFYQVLIDTANDGIYISELLTKTVDASGNTQLWFENNGAYNNSAFGTDVTTFSGDGWYTAAPEPTSGLLLLFGLAGLALKRKRV